MIVPAQFKDIESIWEIEKECFLTPWSKESFYDELKHAYSHLWVAKKQQEVVGFICFWILWDEMHILNLAVKKKLQGQGIGTQLLKKAISFAQKQRLKWIGLEVRESNLKALNLYQKLGFKKVGRRPRYYTDTGEDAILMTLRLKIFKK